VIVTYVPAGAEPRQWTFRPLDISSREAELVEDYTGRTYTSWSEGERAKMLAQFPDPEPVNDGAEEEGAEGKDTAPSGAAGSGESPTS
jgi:hypothetical protein